MTSRLAVSGTGYIARIHAAAAQAAGARVVAVVNHRAESRVRFAERFDVRRQYDSVPDLLAAGGIDGLIICTPNAVHAPETLAALEAGLPVLVEKPMALDAIEAARMHETARRVGVPLMVAHCWRFDDEARWLRGHIADGRLGKIVRTKSQGIHIGWGPDGWFTRRQLAGGGALPDMGIHALDVTRYLLGDPSAANVYARVGTHYRDVEVDDTGLVIIAWPDGATSSVESGWWQPHADGPEASSQVFGTDGFGRLYPTWIRRTDGEIEDPGFTFPREPHNLPSMYEAQMRAFLRAVATGRVEEAGSDVGLANMRIVDAAYESARTGEVVHLATP